MENLSRLLQKQKRKKKHLKGLSFITQFKIEFLLPFTSCRKVLRKMPAWASRYNVLELGVWVSTLSRPNGIKRQSP